MFYESLRNIDRYMLTIEVPLYIYSIYQCPVPRSVHFNNTYNSIKLLIPSDGDLESHTGHILCLGLISM